MPPPQQPADLRPSDQVWRDGLAWSVEAITSTEVTLIRSRPRQAPLRRIIPLAELEERGYTLTPPT
ncbi:hypothetical protein [Deinococcus gobiensis]|uniref:Uncharacterized protein n=1 Tax=Deinococcus gobiensis (strain DSM 21396 / JCM 16679 / CGMCC 1.7299 / I-0) TaxID=745776 RepID=H8H1X5_DEIGI|nr:hypothetical protein [Deinococcus gobiensis]AFD27522.1 hypothetical protein DGo_PB0253 [Deinococcus gobiensis I-0]